MSDSESRQSTIKIYNWKFVPDYSAINESPIFSMFVKNIELKWQLVFFFDERNRSVWTTGRVASCLKCILRYHSKVKVRVIISTSIESLFGLGIFEAYFSRENTRTVILYGNAITDATAVAPRVFNVTCKIEIDEANFNSDLKPVQIVRDFECLVDDEKTSDVLLLTKDGGKLHAHKALLSSQSPVFASMFNHDMAEKRSNIVEIKDISYEVVKQLLLFIYAGKVDVSEENAPNLESLYVAADKYCLDDLKRHCSCAMIEAVTVGNALRYLELAHTYKDEPFKSRIMRFVLEQAEEIADSPELRQLQDADLMRDMFVALIKKKSDFEVIENSSVQSIDGE